MGGVPFMMDRYGTFVLSDRPAMLMAVLITYLGNGIITLIDGVPDADGYFPTENGQPESLRMVSPGVATNDFPGAIKFYWSTVLMGQYQTSGGFNYGLTVRCLPHEDSFSSRPEIAASASTPFAPKVTIVWMPSQASPPKNPLGAGRPPIKLAASAKDGISRLEVLARPGPGSLTRMALLEHEGDFRLSRRNAELYSLLISHPGAGGEVAVRNGRGEEIFGQPCAIAGSSFNVQMFAEGGLTIESRKARSPAPMIAAIWREGDRQVK